MKKCLIALLLALCPILSIAETPTARPDVEELLVVMQLEKNMTAAMDSVKKMVPQMMANMAAQGKISASEVEKTQAMQQKLMNLIQEEMSWAKIKVAFVQIYSESLTPDEVKGITAFYKSPAGQAFLDKQPVILQKTMAWQQSLMKDLMPKIQAFVESETKAASKEK